MVILDTCIIIDHLRRSPNSSTSDLVQLLTAQPDVELAISTITVQELYVGKSSRIPEKEKDLMTVIALCTVLPETYEIAKIAGILTRDTEVKLGLADAAIAATAIHYHAQLFTRNTRDFSAIPNLTLVTLA